MLSSAKLQTSDFIMEKNKSFTKMLNNKGPSIHPCGTPVSISRHELKDDPIFVPCLRFKLALN